MNQNDKINDGREIGGKGGREEGWGKGRKGIRKVGEREGRWERGGRETEGRKEGEG